MVMSSSITVPPIFTVGKLVNDSEGAVLRGDGQQWPWRRHMRARKLKNRKNVILYQLVDTKMQKHDFIPICRRKKHDFIPTQKMRKEHENWGKNMPWTNFYVEPTRDGFFLPCSRGPIGCHVKLIFWPPWRPMKLSIVAIYPQLSILLNDILV